MNGRLSNQQRVLLDALRAGSVHSHDIHQELRIHNASQRVNELRALGCEIDAKTERRGRSHGVRYRLRFIPIELGAVDRRTGRASPVRSDGPELSGEPTNESAGVPQKGPGVRRLPAPVGSNPPVVGEWQLVANYLGDEPLWYWNRVDVPEAPSRQMALEAA